MAWVIPISLAYVPGVLIGFLASTLLTVRYRVPPPQPPTGSWREGQWPPVTVVGAARNEERAIVPTLQRIAGLAYAGPLEVVLADNNSTDRTAERAPLVTTVDADTLLHPAALTYLVAQGAFSAYWTEDVRAVGG
jgi:poly-beta-1,6-N-acetyl-D-glucosamine synthase